MRIIISPAKKMNVDADSLPCQGLPAFLPRTERLLSALRAMDAAELKRLWKCNDQIAALNIRRLEAMDLRRNLTPAILSYEGIQYQYMAPAVFGGSETDYIQDHLRILSGFYGVVKPFDGIVPYRLEMQAKASPAGDLYRFWGDKLYREVTDGDHFILNLASKEYSKCVERYLTPEDTYLTCVFGELTDGKVKQKGTLAKMARGEMVRWLAENQVEDAEKIKEFDRLGYHFDEERSTDREFVFLEE